MITMKKKFTKKNIIILFVLAFLFIGILFGAGYMVRQKRDNRGTATASDEESAASHAAATATDEKTESTLPGLETTSQEPESETEAQSETAAQRETTAQKATQQGTSAQSESKAVSGETATTQKTTEKLIISNQADTFFQNSVFAGDSVLTGLQYYVMRQEKGFLGNPVFLTLNSFSAFWDLQPVTSTSIHPEYQGQKGTVEDLVSTIAPEKVFLFFGINDMNMTGLDKAVENYKEVISRILKKNPNVQIYIISTTNMYKGSDTLNLTNKNIDSLNAKMKSFCAQKGYGYIDITSYLTGSDGTLLEAYSSDHYVHQTNAAYEVWVNVLRSYATEQINKAEEESRKAAEEASSRKAAEEASVRASEEASREESVRASEEASREESVRASEEASREESIQASEEAAAREEEQKRENQEEPEPSGQDYVAEP